MRLENDQTAFSDIDFYELGGDITFNLAVWKYWNKAWPLFARF